MVVSLTSPSWFDDSWSCVHHGRWSCRSSCALHGHCIVFDCVCSMIMCVIVPSDGSIAWSYELSISLSYGILVQWLVRVSYMSWSWFLMSCLHDSSLFSWSASIPLVRWSPVRCDMMVIVRGALPNLDLHLFSKNSLWSYGTTCISFFNDYQLQYYIYSTCLMWWMLK